MNPHALRRQNLNLVRLPIPPHPRTEGACSQSGRPMTTRRVGFQPTMVQAAPAHVRGVFNAHAPSRASACPWTGASAVWPKHFYGATHIFPLSSRADDTAPVRRNGHALARRPPGLSRADYRTVPRLTQRRVGFQPTTPPCHPITVGRASARHPPHRNRNRFLSPRPRKNSNTIPSAVWNPPATLNPQCRCSTYSLPK